MPLEDLVQHDAVEEAAKPDAKHRDGCGDRCSWSDLYIMPALLSGSAPVQPSGVSRLARPPTVGGVARIGSRLWRDGLRVVGHGLPADGPPEICTAIS